MKPLSEMKNHKQRFIRSFLMAVLFIAVGAALGFCQVIEIKGEVHRDAAPLRSTQPITPIISSLDVPSESIFLTPADEAQMASETLSPINSTIEPASKAETKPTIEPAENNRYVSTTSRDSVFQSVLEQQTANTKTAVVSANKEGWKSFYNDAVRESVESERPIMLLFTGSDWCPTCRRLDLEILRTKTFADWSRENVIKVELNFPRSYRLPSELAQQNQQLRTRYASYLTTGFPAALFVDSEGKVLGKARYTTAGVDAWLRQANVALEKVVRKSQQQVTASPIKNADSSQSYGQSILD